MRKELIDLFRNYGVGLPFMTDRPIAQKARKAVVIATKRAKEGLPPGVKGKKATLWIKQGGVCAYCPFVFTRSYQATKDHVVPYHRGGKDNLDNMVLACKACNHAKANLTSTELREVAARYIRMATIAETYEKNSRQDS